MKFFIFLVLLFFYSCANVDTSDICLDNPCVENHKTVCTHSGETYLCSCNPGYKDKYGVCIVDSGDNICSPNPCKDENRNICNSDNDTPICLCNNGFYENDEKCIENTLECDENQHQEGESCINNSKMVDCSPIIAPENASLDEILQVEIVWNNGNWNTPADCTWTCNSNYHPDGNLCIQNTLICEDNEHEENEICVSNTKMTNCINNTPSTGLNVDAQVEVVYTQENGWSTAIVCEWYCNPNYIKTETGCVVVGNPGIICTDDSVCLGDNTFCADYTEFGYCSSSCVTDGDTCMTNGVCSSGVCYKKCAISDDTTCERDDLICINGENNIGGVCRLRCYENTDCNTGYCSSSGHCEINYTSCNSDTVSNSGCEASNTCLDDNGSTYCYPNGGKVNAEVCTGNECIAQYGCLGNTTDGYTCMEYCRVDGDCSNGPICSTPFTGEDYGYCPYNYSNCDADPVNNNGCAINEICFNDGGTYCIESMGKLSGEICIYGNDCIIGYGCIGPDGGEHTCQEYCRSISDCSNGSTCTHFANEDYGYCN